MQTELLKFHRSFKLIYDLSLNFSFQASRISPHLKSDSCTSCTQRKVRFKFQKPSQCQVLLTSFDYFLPLQHIQHFLMHNLHVEANFTANGFFIINRAIGFKVSADECRWKFLAKFIWIFFSLSQASSRFSLFWFSSGSFTSRKQGRIDWKQEKFGIFRCF